MTFLRILGFVAGTAIATGLLAKLGLPMMLAFMLAIIPGALAFVGVGKLLAWLVGRSHGPFARWYAYAGEVWAARKQDHRLIMVGAGLRRVHPHHGHVQHPVDDLPAAAQPRLRCGRIDLPPGTTLQQTEAVADKVAAICQQGPQCRTRVRARSGRDRRDIPIVLKKDREHDQRPSSSATSPRPWRRLPTRGSTSRARAAAGPTAAADATSCCSSAATTPRN